MKNALRLLAVPLGIPLVVGALFLPTSLSAAGTGPKEEIATKAVQQLNQGMRAKLMESLKNHGPAGAIDVCALEAPVLADKLGRELGVVLKRTSLKLRNPQNAPDQAEAKVLADLSAASRSGGALPQGVTPLPGEKSRFYQVILVQKPCLQCHGDSATISEAVRKRLAATYPEDRATGYKEGDVRGIISVTVK